METKISMNTLESRLKLNKPTFYKTKLVSALSILIFTPSIHASMLQKQLAEKPSPFEYTANLNYIHQSSSESDLKSSNTLSADWSITYKSSSSSLWHLHAELATTQHQNTVAQFIADSNADAGSAVDKDDHGRLQISELFYQTAINPQNQISIGLLNATVFLDSTQYANDENIQFITPSLVNNPVIDFPDYVLGLAYQHQNTKEISSTLFISSTHGLADNTARNYSNLFEIQDDQKGVFSAIEAKYSIPQLEVKSGVWLHNGEHEALNNSQQTNLSNYGVYLNIDKNIKRHGFSARFGASNPKVASTSRFLSLSYQYSKKSAQLGVGYSHSFKSSYNTEPSNNPQVVEAYWNKSIGKYWAITPSIQYFIDPEMNNNGLSVQNKHLYNANFRLTYQF